jgi:hypothetical protein
LRPPITSCAARGRRKGQDQINENSLKGLLWAPVSLPTIIWKARDRSRAKSAATFGHFIQDNALNVANLDE